MIQMSSHYYQWLHKIWKRKSAVHHLTTLWRFPSLYPEVVFKVDCKIALGRNMQNPILFYAGVVSKSQSLTTSKKEERAMQSRDLQQ